MRDRYAASRPAQAALIGSQGPYGPPGRGPDDDGFIRQTAAHKLCLPRAVYLWQSRVMTHLRIVSEDVLAERDQRMVQIQRDLASSIRALDDIRQACERESDTIGASFMAGTIETIVAFANAYFCRLL